MSARLLGLAFDVEAPTPSAKLVLLKLVDCCDDAGKNIFPAVATVARAAQCDVRTVQRHLALFCRVGLLRLMREGGAGRGSTAQYEMNLEVLRQIAAKGWASVEHVCLTDDEPADDAGERADAGASHANGAGLGHEAEGDDGEKGDTMSPYAPPLRVTGRTVQGDTGVTQPLNRNPQELERERGRGPEHGRGLEHAASHAAGAEADDGGPVPQLADFVKCWPTSATDSRQRVELAWAGLPLADRRAAIERVPDFLAELKRQKRSHVPAGFTYLNERKWTLLPEMKRATQAEVPIAVAAFSKVWWALFHAARAGRGRAALLMLHNANEGRGWGCRQSDADAARPDDLKAFPAHGEVAQAFLAEAAREGFRFPKFTDKSWVFLPGHVVGHPAITEAQTDGGL